MRFSAGDKIIMFSKCLCDCLFLCLCHCHCLFAGHVMSHHRSDHMFQGSLGVFFCSVFKSVDGKVISRAVLRGPAKNIPPQLEQPTCTLYNLSSVSFLTIVGWCLHHISTGSRQAGIDLLDCVGIDLSDICS